MSLYKAEKVKSDFSIARLKKDGENYEIIIDSETAMKVKNGEASVDEALLVQKVFKDAKAGDVQGNLVEVFGTDDVMTVAKEIIMNGEVQLSEEYRRKVVEEKRNQVLEELSKKAADPETHYPIPRQRIELGMEKAGYKIRIDKGVKEQVKELMDLLVEVMPITFKDLIITIISPPQFIGQTYGVTKMGEVISQDYAPDGSLIMQLKIPAGRMSDLSDKLKSISHGLIKIKEA